jgi:hypothetical protein
MQTKTFDSLRAQINGEELKGFWKSSDGTQNTRAGFHFCAHRRDFCSSSLDASWMK